MSGFCNQFPLFFYFNYISEIHYFYMLDIYLRWAIC
jgi:hypothetical protein